MFYRASGRGSQRPTCPIADPGTGLVFAYIPAWQYGQKDFGIFIEQTSFGEILTNSLIAEVIEKAA